MTVELIEGLAAYAEDFNAAAEKHGEQGVTILLRKIAHDLRTRIADAFDAAIAETQTGSLASVLPPASAPEPTVK
jgi:hypothetical protein